MWEVFYIVRIFDWKAKSSYKINMASLDFLTILIVRKSWGGVFVKIGIALSGGGIRGIAHAGVLKALEDNDIKIDIIGGCSSGSMIAALYAMGYSPYYIYILFKRYAKDIAGINSKPFIEGIQKYIMNKKNVINCLKDGEYLEKLCNRIALRKGITK